MKSKSKIVEKPWGREIWMANNSLHDYCGKILEIDQGCSTSLHFHMKKHETFYILKGTLQVDVVDVETAETNTVTLSEGRSFEISTGIPHRLIAYDGDVTFVEISNYHSDGDSHRVVR